MSEPLLNADRIEAIAKMAAMGLPPREATVASGVSQSTFYQWWRRGEGDATSGDADRVGSVYAEFYREVWSAKVGLDSAVLKQFIKRFLLGSEGDWRTFAWWLGKRMPDHFGEKVGQRDLGNGYADQVELISDLRRAAGLSVKQGVTDKAEEIRAGDERGAERASGEPRVS